MPRKANIPTGYYVVDKVTGTRYSGVRATLEHGGLVKRNPDRTVEESDYYVDAVEGDRGVRFVTWHDQPDFDIDLPSDTGIAPGQVFRLDLTQVRIKVDD